MFRSGCVSSSPATTCVSLERWAGPELGNGDLLAAAETESFAVMVTGDKNLSYQQNLTDRKLALVVLSTNDWKVIRDNPAPVVAAISAAKPGSFELITF